jgi:hypothetical protein
MLRYLSFLFFPITLFSQTTNYRDVSVPLTIDTLKINNVNYGVLKEISGKTNGQEIIVDCKIELLRLSNPKEKTEMRYLISKSLKEVTSKTITINSTFSEPNEVTKDEMIAYHLKESGRLKLKSIKTGLVGGAVGTLVIITLPITVPITAGTVLFCVTTFTTSTLCLIYEIKSAQHLKKSGEIMYP